MPRVGVRLGAEESTVKVTITYEQARSLTFPKGTIEIPQHLEISLKWEGAIETEDDKRVAYIDVGNDMNMTMWTQPPPRLLSLWGPIPDLRDWQLAPAIIGDDIWQQALAVVDADHGTAIELEVEVPTLAPLYKVWLPMYEVARIVQIRRMPTPPGERDRELEIVMSDPGFVKKGIKVMRELFGDPRDQPTKK